jgi:hypothetical protein
MTEKYQTLVENVVEFRYLGITVKQTNKQTPWPLVHKRTIPTEQWPGNYSNKSKLVQEIIKRIMNSGNACYHSVQNFCLLVSCLQTHTLKCTRLIISACASVWVQNLVSNIMEGEETNGV